MDANSVRDLEGSISLRAYDTGAGLRLVFDGDEESFFDLNLDTIPNSEEFEFQISFSSLSAVSGSPGQIPAEELFRDGRILPLEAKSSSETEIYQGDTLMILESSMPMIHGVGGSVDPKARSEIGGEKGLKKDQELVESRTRKTSKMARVFSNGMVKFFIKFPSEKIRSTFISVIKSYQFLPIHPKGGGGAHGNGKTQGTSQMYRRLTVPFSRWLTSKKNSGTKSGNNTFRSILEAADFSFGGGDGGAKRSSRGSSESSPSRGSAYGGKGAAVERDGSISSAVAHCKMSR